MATAKVDGAPKNIPEVRLAEVIPIRPIEASISLGGLEGLAALAKGINKEEQRVVLDPPVGTLPQSEILKIGKERRNNIT